MPERETIDERAFSGRLTTFFEGLRFVSGTSRDIEERLKGRLNGFFSGLRPVIHIARDAQEKLDLRAATSFSIFEYFRVNETALSDVFADLLNPKGRHGQGDRFLRLFLDAIDVMGTPADTSRCRIHREFATDAKRRIDIVIELSGPPHFLIGIENKPKAPESQNQLSDYAAQLDSWAKGRWAKDRWALVYMSGDGSHPRSLTEIDREKYERDGHLRLMPFRTSGKKSDISIEGWIQQSASRVSVLDAFEDKQ